MTPASGGVLGVAKGSKRRTLAELRERPLPSTPEQLADLTNWYFGTPLSLRKLIVHGKYVQYEVEQSYNSYHGAGRLFSTHSIEGCDYSRDFWGHILGKLYCGGIARASYGQCICPDDQIVRLEKLTTALRSAAEAARAGEKA